jgi:hypothetical protein
MNRQDNTIWPNFNLQIYIPTIIFNNQKLNNTDKILHAVISNLNGPDGCHTTDSDLAKMMFVSEKEIQKSIMNLLREKIIRINIETYRTINVIVK